MSAAFRAAAGNAAPADAASVSTVSHSVQANDFFSVKVSGEPDSGSLTSVSIDDDMGVGNSYTPAVSGAGGVVGTGGRRQRAFWCRNATTDGTCVITATMAGAVPVYGFSIHNTIFTGIRPSGDPVAQTAGAAPVFGGRTQTITGVEGANNQSTGSLGTPAEDGCAVDSMGASNSFPDTFTVGTGLTSTGVAPDNPSSRSGYAIQTTAAAVNAQYNNDLGGDVVTMAVAYLPAASSLTLTPTGSQASSQAPTVAPTMFAVPAGSQVSAQSSAPTVLAAFNALVGIRIKWS